MSNPHDHKDPDPSWIEVFEHELEHMVQHGLNLMTIALVAAREAIFGDDDDKDEQ